MNGKPKIVLVFGLAISKVKLQYHFGFFRKSKKVPIFKAYYDVCSVYYSLEFYGFMAQITLLWP